MTKQPFSDYLASLAGRRVDVAGVGVSNLPLVRLLCRAGAVVTAHDKKTVEELGDTARELSALGVTLRCGAEYLQRLDGELIYRTPGLRPDHPAIAAAVARGAELRSEMEDFLAVCPCRVLAVTGSDGKTTTTTLIAEMLRAAGRTVHLGGNIGRPLLSDTPDIRPEDIAVLELSSFQLLTMTASPSVAVVTNLTPNHLDVHPSMEEYRAAKEHIFRYQSPDDRAVFNFDCPVTREMARSAPGGTVFFSRRVALEEGFFLQDGTLVRRKDGVTTPLFPVSDILLPGAHNVENYLAACAAVEGLVPPEVCAHVAQTFAGVPHRIQYIRTVHGARYYHDSIASSPTRTLAGLRSFPQKVILIAGGYDKKIPFDALGPALCAHVKHLLLIGATAPLLRACVEHLDGAPVVEDCGTLDVAVARAREIAREGDVVLLSPACASFDQFQNFEARGEAFVRLVNSL